MCVSPKLLQHTYIIIFIPLLIFTRKIIIPFDFTYRNQSTELHSRSIILKKNFFFSFLKIKVIYKGLLKPLLHSEAGGCNFCSWRDVVGSPATSLRLSGRDPVWASAVIRSSAVLGAGSGSSVRYFFMPVHTARCARNVKWLARNFRDQQQELLQRAYCEVT